VAKGEEDKLAVSGKSKEGRRKKGGEDPGYKYLKGEK
jgi:hypothetical protein